MKAFTIAAAVLALSGCDTMRTIFPHTTAGFEENGVVGAIDGASGVLLATCRTLDGQIVHVAADDVAASTGKDDLLNNVRERRQQACAVIGAVQAVANGIDAAVPVEVNVHRNEAPTG